nr:pyridoxamine 5'-phosphate oxidase family protein [Chloroflexota bacterium]
MLTFTANQLAFLQNQRAGRLATAASDGAPHVIPVCYACDGVNLYIALDAKPK